MEFEMKDLGSVIYFLEIEVAYSEKEYFYLKGSVFWIYFKKLVYLGWQTDQ